MDPVNMPNPHKVMLKRVREGDFLLFREVGYRTRACNMAFSNPPRHCSDKSIMAFLLSQETDKFRNRFSFAEPNES
jgi:hypothetical protein